MSLNKELLHKITASEEMRAFNKAMIDLIIGKDGAHYSDDELTERAYSAILAAIAFIPYTVTQNTTEDLLGKAKALKSVHALVKMAHESVMNKAIADIAEQALGDIDNSEEQSA